MKALAQCDTLQAPCMRFSLDNSIPVGMVMSGNQLTIHVLCNLRMYTRTFAALSRQKNKNVEPGLGKIHS